MTGASQAGVAPRLCIAPEGLALQPHRRAACKLLGLTGDSPEQLGQLSCPISSAAQSTQEDFPHRTPGGLRGPPPCLPARAGPKQGRGRTGPGLQTRPPAPRRSGPRSQPRPNLEGPRSPTAGGAAGLGTGSPRARAETELGAGLRGRVPVSSPISPTPSIQLSVRSLGSSHFSAAAAATSERKSSSQPVDPALP